MFTVFYWGNFCTGEPLAVSRDKQDLFTAAVSKMYSGRVCKNIKWSALSKMCLRTYASSEGPDQPAHPRSLIRAFAVR